MKTIMQLFFVMLLIVSVSCSKDSGPSPENIVTETAAPKPAPTASDETITGALTSSFNSETYPIIIFLPAEYETNKGLPVIYLTDGVHLYNKLLAIVKILKFEAIIVAVGDKVNQARLLDFTPSFCGGGTVNDDHINFYNFITKDLVSYIDTRYENDHSLRSLIGYSVGGSFSTGALFMEDPEALIFQRFIAVDPVFPCESSNFEKVIDNMEDNISSSGVAANFKLFGSRSNEYELNWWSGLMETKAQELSWLDFAYEEFLNEDHVSVLEPSFSEGLRFIYGL